jgi:hypothetical protein
MTYYKQQSVSGTKYKRASRIIIDSVKDSNPVINFVAEEIVTIDGEDIHKDAGNITGTFTAENAGTQFDLVNPATGDLLGAKATYQDVQVILFSLFFHLDAAQSAPE